MKMHLKTKKVFVGLSLVMLCFCGCGNTNDKSDNQNLTSSLEKADETKETPKPDETAEPFSFINAEGKTLKSRILTPQGYQRTKAEKNSLASFLRNYKMKKDGSPVLLYDGSEKGNPYAHIAVFKLPLEKEDLQQCADSVMRVYGEYYYKLGQYDKINFSLGGGFQANYRKWSQGNGIGISGDNLYWTSQAENDTSYNSFKRFMRLVFAYSGTLNLEEDSKKIKLKDISVGDIFIRGGSPGHVVMVVDLCKNATGEKAFLLAQGYMPAQEFHVITNPLHPEDPWYYQNEISFPLDTPEYMFEKGALRRPDLSS